tara:strand:- start:1104 stop:1322 length:219 start_codon:yes stop_codon:yes gene_type:complete
MTKTETVKRGYHLKFAEDLTPDEVSALGKRLEFHIGFMAMNVASGRMEYVRDQASKILEIAQAMKDNGEYQI